jgi:hypothetical protein
LKPISVIVMILNGLTVAGCVLFFIGSLMLQLGDGGQPAVVHLNNVFGLWGACLLAYGLICFTTGFARRKGPLVFAAGIVAHVFLAAFATLPLTDKKNGFQDLLFCCMIAAIYAALWWRMYSKLGPAGSAPATPGLHEAA